MAVSAFKSSSRRSNLTNPSSSSSSSTATPSVRPNADASPARKPATLRRSRSVSAFSRTSSEIPASSSDDFLNKRDNPLFWSTGSPPDLEINPVSVAPLKGVVSDSGEANRKKESSDGRGRQAARNPDALPGRKEVGRSLSRVDAGRRNRSVSRGPVSRRHFVNSESEAEQECCSVKKIGSRNNSDFETGNDKDKRSLVRTRNSSDMADQKGLKTWSSRHLALEPSRDSALNSSRSHPSTWDDEEKTIKVFCEQMKPLQSSVKGDPLESDATASGIYETVRSEVRRAISEIQNDLQKAIQRSNTSAIATTNITDIPPDLVSPSAVELVLDIRREYAKKLEQSQERARKLRGDLAVEEHRGLELSRILKEVLPDPKTSNVPKSRTTRKGSIEKRKMSKRLTEEAMAYFDECVSLSTFDSSDFSSQEDAPFELAGVNAYVANNVSSLQASSSASTTNSSNSCLKDKQDSGFQVHVANINDAADLIASSSHKEPHLDQCSPTSVNAARHWKSPFSFARNKPMETTNLQQGIQKYIRNSEKDIRKGDNDINFHLLRSSNCDLDEHNLQAVAQSFVFDRVVMRNRIESSSLLLCSGGVSVSFSPFASFF
ncbi:uncharacterized protein LOC21403166 isoform X1 [Morus notabilis]|uniref:uncharacterized protein LOC21403166 isoform X1 n=1 Tax=Morus notabilis TaxID=981085 RepID=UPI000CED7D6F|nr:uncharacterized protein LOC21403166 isoform X1 [Morus notabilis]